MRKKDIQKLPREALFQLSLQRGKIIATQHMHCMHNSYCRQICLQKTNYPKKMDIWTMISLTQIVLINP